MTSGHIYLLIKKIMTTIINSPSPSPTEDSSAIGLVVGIIFGVLVVILFLYFGVRYYWYNPSIGAPAQSTVVVPSSGTTVNVTAPVTVPTPVTNK